MLSTPVVWPQASIIQIDWNYWQHVSGSSESVLCPFISTLIYETLQIFYIHKQLYYTLKHSLFKSHLHACLSLTCFNLKLKLELSLKSVQCGSFPLSTSVISPAPREGHRDKQAWFSVPKTEQLTRRTQTWPSFRQRFTCQKHSIWDNQMPLVHL